MADLEVLKKEAALKALGHVKSGMFIGLGSGSTAKHFIAELGNKLASAELSNITAVATSKASDQQARALNIPMLELSGQKLDMAIDGMDEVDPNLNAIKGLGGALTREKMVESCTNFFILIGDETKTVTHIGEKAPIPVEIVQFAWQSTQAKLKALNTKPVLRMHNNEAFVTDNGNFILDCHIEPPQDIYALANAFANTPGVLEHGLFLDMAKLAYVATQDGVLTFKNEN